MSFSGYKDEAEHVTITNDGFFPDVSTQTLVDVYRVPPDFAVQALENQLRLAVAWANRQLQAWRAEQVLAGYATLAAVPADMLGDVSVREVYYRAAVFNECRAQLVQESKLLVRRSDAANAATESGETEAGYHELAVKALADLLGVGRVRVGLV